MAVTVHLSGSLVGSAKSRCVGLIRFPPLVTSDPPPVTTSSEAQIALVDLVDPSPLPDRKPPQLLVFVIPYLAQVVVLVGIVVQVVGTGGNCCPGGGLGPDGNCAYTLFDAAVLTLAIIMDDRCIVDTATSTITLIEISKVLFPFQMLYMFLSHESYSGLYFSTSIPGHLNLI